MPNDISAFPCRRCGTPIPFSEFCPKCPPPPSWDDFPDEPLGEVSGVTRVTQHVALSSPDEAWTRGLSAEGAGRAEEAEQCFRLVVENGGRGESEPHSRLAGAQVAQGKWEEARTTLTHALALSPRSPVLLCQMGAIMGFLARHAEARAYLDEAIAISPGYPDAHWNRSLHRLTTGDWLAGWDEYQWGRVNGNLPTRHIRPEWGWTGTSRGTLYVWAEQGLGDTLMLLRLLPEARRAGEFTRVVLEVQEQLLPLLADHPFADRVVARQPDNGFVGQWDHHISLFSLPRVLGLCGPGGMGMDVDKPYITPPFPKFSENSLSVGLCWKGNPGHANDKHRSLGNYYDSFGVTLGNDERIRFYSLVPGSEDAQLYHHDLSDILATARLIASLDLVITVDTMVAHLAGAMGKPVWTLLSADPDWRWGLTGETTPFYPSMRLYRQEVPNDWTAPLKRVADDLKTFVKPKPVTTPATFVNRDLSFKDV